MSDEPQTPELFGVTEIWRERVIPDWCDYNNHLNMAYYALIFDHATDAFLDSIGLDRSYREAHDASTFAVETHINYLAEVRNGEEVFCTTHLLDYDAKRIHFFHRMYHAEQGYLSATTEIMSVHVDMNARKVAPMTDELQGNLERLLEVHSKLPAPDQKGRVMEIRRR